MKGPFGRQGLDATLRQHCPQMSQRHCSAASHLANFASFMYLIWEKIKSQDLVFSHLSADVSVIEFAGVAAATTSIKVISTAGEEEQQRQNKKEDEKIMEEQKVELGFGVSSVLSKMGSATKALKQSVENTNIISEFNREQAKFIKEKSEFVKE